MRRDFIFHRTILPLVFLFMAEIASWSQMIGFVKVGEWPGYARDRSGYALAVRVSGNRAYLAAGYSGFQVINVEDPDNPTRLGRLCIPRYSIQPCVTGTAYAAYIYDVAVSGQHAYCATDVGLHVVDITDPENPVIAGRTNAGSFGRLALSSNVVSVIGDGALKTIDVSNAGNPVVLGSVPITQPQAIFVSGSIAYISAGFGNPSGLVVVDISNPANPTKIGSTTNSFGVAGDLVVSGHHAYVGFGSTLQVIDVSNPAQPSVVGSTFTGGTLRRIVASGAHVYAISDAKLQVFGIGNPTNPIAVGNHPVSSLASGIAISTNTAYVADGNGGLLILNVTDPQQPVGLGRFTPSGYSSDVAVSGNHAFLADEFAGLHRLEKSSPTKPAWVETLPQPSVRRIAVSGNLAYAIRTSGGGDDFWMEVIDVSNPSNAVSRAMLAIPNFGGIQPGGILVAGNLVYLAYGGWMQVLVGGVDQFRSATYGGIEVIDVTNPSNPVRKGGYLSYDRPSGLARAGDHVYLAYSLSVPIGLTDTFTSAGLRVLSISNPTNPVVAGGYETVVRPTDVVVSSNYVYLVGSSPNFQVIDVTSRTNPMYVAGLAISGEAARISVAGKFAYVASGSAGLQAIDITNPANPILAASFDTSGIAESVVTSGDFVYVADGEWGLQILRPDYKLMAVWNTNAVRLSWSLDATNYVLGTTTNLSSPNWQMVSTPPQTNADCFTLTLPATNPAAFFWLMRP